MKPQRTMIIGALVAVAAVALLAMACGDDDGGPSNIRTEKGLAVAAAAGALSGDGQSAGGGEAADITTPQSATGGGAAFPGSYTAKGGGGFAPVPQLLDGGTGITVQGYGSATVDADAAMIDFYFGTGYYDKPVPLPEPRTEPGAEGDGSSGSAPPSTGSPEVSPQGQAQPITEETLQPVIDAIVGAGVSREDIEFIGQSYYDPYVASATLRVKVTNLDSVDAVVQEATNAAANLSGISLQSTNVAYTVNDCSALEKAAMKAAVEDAKERGAAFAEALGVGLGNVTGASHYSYSPFGGSPCEGASSGPYPLTGVAYAEGQSREVQVFANISVTYAIQ